MAVEKILVAPSDFPHAHLYLDDIEEISRVLVDAHSAANAEETKVWYEVDNLRMDSIAELEKHGGSVKKLKVIVGQYGPEFSLGAYSSPYLMAAGMQVADRWSVHAKLMEIIRPRRRAFRDALEALPGWVVPLTIGIISSLPLASLEVLQFRWLRVALGIGIAEAVVIFVVISVFRSDRVSLTRSRERSRANADKIRQYVHYAGFVLVGYILKWVLDHLLKK